VNHLAAGPRKEEFQIAEVAVAEAVVHPRVRSNRFAERDLDLLTRLAVVHIVQVVDARQTDSGCTVAPGDREPGVGLISSSSRAGCVSWNRSKPMTDLGSRIY
jgi:hypothetical protein